jgi:hypothetical protein
MLLSLASTEVAAGEGIVPELTQLDAYNISYTLDLRHTQIQLETDDLQYGVLFNKGELSVGDRETGWKTTLDLPDQQIKLEWNF